MTVFKSSKQHKQSLDSNKKDPGPSSRQQDAGPKPESPKHNSLSKKISNKMKEPWLRNAYPPESTNRNRDSNYGQEQPDKHALQDFPEAKQRPERHTDSSARDRHQEAHPPGRWGYGSSERTMRAAANNLQDVTNFEMPPDDHSARKTGLGFGISDQPNASEHLRSGRGHGGGGRSPYEDDCENDHDCHGRSFQTVDSYSPL